MARALAESWNLQHPEYPFFVLLLDSPQGFFRPESEPFHTILISELDIPNLEGFLFKYTVLEASTAVKPYLLARLFDKYSIAKLLYLDPDIFIYRRLDSLRTELDRANLLLTPHLLSPLPDDGRILTEHGILQAGSYNLGFLGIRNSLVSRALLRWWSKKLYHHCLVSFKDNLFVDQRWMDMAPSLFDEVRILRDPGYNVAYWNLHERSVSVGDEVKVNGGPLYFFHFSGFDPNKPWVVSKYQDRFDMKTIGDTRKLYSAYNDLLLHKGWPETSMWPYGHDYFSNGMRIPASARRYYWGLGPAVAHLGNPFNWLTDYKAAPDDGARSRTLSSLPFGINIIGHLESEKGVGEGARSNLRILRATGLPYCVNNWRDIGSQNVEHVADDMLLDNPYRINFISLNADSLYEFARARPGYLRGRFNIGYWAWELPEFPPEWDTSFAYVDEVWTPSKFARDSVASHSPVPVGVVPHSLEMDEADIVPDRATFSIDQDVFLFLFFFDFHSFLERKNPLGLIHAFKKAFGKRKDVQLLIKSAHSSEHQRELALLERASSGLNVRIFDAIMSREEKQNLMKAADCYVSLHRSEGFGLTMAESMMFGKPVIATGYSGNVDFMSDDDSFLVPYRLIRIDETHGPYKAGYHWADPDLDCACDLMRHVEKNREAARDMGEKARTKIRNLLRPETIAAGVRKRLDELGLLETSAPQECKVHHS